MKYVTICDTDYYRIADDYPAEDMGEYCLCMTKPSPLSHSVPMDGVVLFTKEHWENSRFVDKITYEEILALRWYLDVKNEPHLYWINKNAFETCDVKVLNCKTINCAIILNNI